MAWGTPTYDFLLTLHTRTVRFNLLYMALLVTSLLLSVGLLVIGYNILSTGERK